jgi:hypothetical protein
MGIAHLLKGGQTLQLTHAQKEKPLREQGPAKP